MRARARAWARWPWVEEGREEGSARTAHPSKKPKREQGNRHVVPTALGVEVGGQCPPCLALRATHTTKPTMQTMMPQINVGEGRKGEGGMTAVWGGQPERQVLLHTHTNKKKNNKPPTATGTHSHPPSPTRASSSAPSEKYKSAKECAAQHTR